AICLKCLRWRPRSRYPSAAALADDLRRFLDGQPIQSWPMAQAARLARWCRRNAIAVGAAAAIVALLGIVLANTRSKLHEAEQARDEAERAYQEAEARRQRFEERERDAVQQSQVTLAALDVGRQDAFKSERAAKEAARQRDEARRTLEDREKSLAEARKQR